MRNFRIRYRMLLLGCVALAGLTAGSQAFAQGPGGGGGGGGFGGGGPGGGGPGGPLVEGVTVSGAQQQFRSSVDSRSYSIVDDLQTTSGSIADALKNVPSLEVDVQGNISLRGDSSVTILIDGKPSGAFRGEGRADALQQMAADQIERVEVMTNPSAAYDPEGGGGVINLITKKGRGAGTTGSVRGNFGTEGRANGAASLSYNTKTLALSGDFGARRNVQKNTVVDERTQTSATGVKTGRRLDSLGTTQTDTENLRLSADYDVTAKTRLSSEVRHNRADMSQDTADAYRNTDAGGLLTGLSDRIGTMDGWRTNTDASLGLRHTFGPGHTLGVDLSLDQEKDRRTREYVNHILRPIGPNSFETFGARTSEVQGEFKIDYVRPMSGEATLKAGYDFEQDDNDYNNLGARGLTISTQATDFNFTNRFHFRQTIQAGYATYERPIGDLTLQAGLRLEYVEVDINQLTSALRETNDYTRLYPSLHLGYRLSDTQQLTASYSHRVRRPRPEDVNPFRVYQDPLNLRAGNPRLKPQETHSLEAGYQQRQGNTYYLATLFYRQSYNGISDVVRDLGGGVLLTTRENLSQNRSGGLELVANGRLNPKLSYTLNGTTFWNEIQSSVAGATRNSAFAFNGRASLNWQVSDKDMMQINGFASGKRLTAQGYVKPNAVLNLGYRHKFSDKLSGLVTAQDLFASSRNATVVKTPILYQEVERRPNARAIFVGLTYTFGAPKKQRDEGFEFENEGGGGGGPG